MDVEHSPESVPVAAVAALAPPRQVPWYSWRRLGYNFLTLSLLAHLLLGVGAAYFVVAVNYPKKKTFTGPPTGNPNKHAVEHKVSLAKTQQRSSAPVAAKRVTTTGASKVALPTMPSMPMDAALTPVSMSGMGGGGIGGLGGGGGGGTGGGGGGPNFFGLRSTGTGTGLVGTFYDLKQTPGRQSTGMTPEIYGNKITQFAQGGFNTGILSNFYKASQPIYATRIFTPRVPAELGPVAFGVEKEVQPRMWMVHYKGTVVAPESGTFRFAGLGDDVLLVRFDGKMVLDGCWSIDTKTVPGQTNYKLDWGAPGKGGTVGIPFTVEEGKSYPIEVAIGEQPGGYSAAALFVMKNGEHFAKDKKGGDIMPVFRTTTATDLPVPPPNSFYAPHIFTGPAWKTQAAKAEFSVFSH